MSLRPKLDFFSKLFGFSNNYNRFAFSVSQTRFPIHRPFVPANFQLRLGTKSFHKKVFRTLILIKVLKRFHANHKREPNCYYFLLRFCLQTEY